MRRIGNLASPAPAPNPTPAPSPAPSPAPPSHEPRLPAPQRYDGNPGGCRGFLTQCDLAFELQPSSYPGDRSRIAYLITLATDKALTWATAIWGQQGAICSNYSDFKEEMLRVFDRSLVGQEAAKRLLRLRQGPGSAADYAITFRTLAADSGWDEQALISVFYDGLSDALKDGLATVETPNDFETLVSLAFQLGNRLGERHRTQPHTRRSADVPAPSWSSAPSSSSDPEPMHIGGTRLSQAERDRRRREGLCFYCGKAGHLRASCPDCPGNGQPRQD
jgi:hypothetical protein